MDKLTGVNGECDTILTITINALPYNQGVVNGSICPGQTITIHGTVYNAPGSYMDTVSSTTGGCDTAFLITINQLSLIPGSTIASYCAGDSVQVYGTYYDSPGTYMDTIASTTGGCDTAMSITISENPLLMGNVSYNGCSGDGYSIVVNGTLYDESNPMGMEQVPGPGCDTLITINLLFAPNTPAHIDPAGPLCTDASPVTLTATPPGGVWSGSVSSNQFDPVAQGPECTR